MSRERVETLAKQTEYLLKKQQELLKTSADVFESLTGVIDDKIKTLKEDDSKDLQDVKVYIVEHNKKSDGQLKEDIEFLNEQLSAINQIKALDDIAKMDELLNMMLNKEQELEEMDKFKTRLDSDVQACVNELNFMFDDIKSAIDEGKIRELKLMIEAVKDQQEKDREKEEKNNCVECSDCSTADNSCCPSEGTNIFGAVKDKDSEDK